jgi:hypothetical protein
MAYLPQICKALLRRHLDDHTWEVVEVAEGGHWWADEHWKVHSRRNSWGLELVLTFLVDPQWEGPRKMGEGVWAVAAAQGLPTDRLSAEQGLAMLPMTRGRFDEKLAAFVNDLDAFRNSQRRAAPDT